jgi:hypothetical protein
MRLIWLGQLPDISLKRCGGSEQKIPWVHASAYFKNGDERVSELE